MQYYLCINENIHDKNKLCTHILFPLWPYRKEFYDKYAKLYFNNYIDFQRRSQNVSLGSAYQYIPDTNIDYEILNKYNFSIQMKDKEQKFFEEVLYDIINQDKAISLSSYLKYRIIKGSLQEIYKDKLFFVVIECANCFPKGEEYKAINLLKKSLEGKKYSIYTDEKQFRRIYDRHVMKLGVQPSYKYYKQFKVSRCMRVILELYNQPILNAYTIRHPEDPKVYLEPYVYQYMISKEETERIVNDIVSLNDKPIKVFAKGFQTSYGHPSFSDVNDPKYFKNNII